ncbi:MAG TPA: phosphate regulon sensor histidine kinase PhoR [Gammaproteobacteria bacterium]|nr:phosphate regulon sensor histidine kinase PhoR [Gammaproteobacteria bacterium]
MLATEYWRLFLISAISGFSGLLFDQLLLGILVGLLIYIAYHLNNIHNLSKWLLDSKTSLEPPEGKGIWFEIFNRIYTLQKRNKSQKIKLASALTRFQDAASAMPDGMLILTQDGKIEWFNQATKRLLGLKSPQDIHQPLINLIRYPAFKQFLASDNHGDEGIEVLSPINEALIIQIRIVPYGKGKALMIARDVTRVSQLEQVRRHFVANISHELRTPLTVLTGYIETLLDNEKMPANPWGEPLQQMYSQTSRMQGIVKDLLLLTRLENYSGPASEAIVDVPELIEMLLEEARMLGIEKKQALTADYDASLKLLGKREEIQSAFSNLVSNAVRYTPKGGKIHMKWFADENGAHFTVIDSGVGVSQMDIPRLTERFFRVDEARSRETGGTGLGLAIVKHVLNRHDARLSIESRVGKGSQFSCHFPKSRTASGDKLNKTVSRINS